MSELRFDGKVAIVTGAGAGLGRAHAILLASRGAKVVVNDLGGDPKGVGNSSRPADAVVQEIRQAGGIAVADYNSVTDGEKVVKTALDSFGRIDILINNAGILRDKSFPRISKEDWDIVHDVHLKGTFLITQAAFPIFKKQRFGRIVMTTSNSGLYGNFGQANYASAKLGIVGLANTVAIEGAKNNVYCNVIAPAAISRLTQGLISPELAEHMKPEYVAPVVAYLCHESCTENGIIIDVGAGWAGKTHLVRGDGAIFRQSITDKVTIENVRDNWQKVVDMYNAKHYNSMIEVSRSLDTVIQHIKSGTGHSAKQIEYDCTPNKFILYALGVGASIGRPAELQYVYEGHKNFCPIPSFFILPSLNALLQTPGSMNVIPGKNATVEKILHGEQYLEILGNLQPGKLYTTIKVAEVLDKGASGVIIFEAESFNDSQELIARNQIVIFASGCGGFNGPRNSTKTLPSIPKPKRAPDMSVSYTTSIDQAAFYRLSGDLNILHIDSDVARRAGFDKPILHGLCSLGISLRIVMGAFAGFDTSLFKAIKVRFANPVIPGQTLRVDMWQEGTRIHFETVVVDNKTVAIIGAYVDLKAVRKDPTAKL